jgi:predicted PhzF superfamily epimerase YddE/YHI9
MDEHPVAVVDAYTDTPGDGIRVGVCPDATALAADQRDTVAAELEGDVTAFWGDSVAVRCGDHDRSSHLDACVAATAHAHNTGYIEADESAPTPGDETVTVTEDGDVTAEVATPQFSPADCDHDTVGAAIDVAPAALADVGQDLPLAVTDGDDPLLVAPVNFFDRLADAAMVPTIPEALDVTGIVAFTLDAAAPDADLHVRPLGVPAVGRAGLVAATYLPWAGAFDDQPDSVGVEFGHATGRPGQFTVTYGERTTLSATATTAIEGDMRVPSASESDIIEL